MPKRSLRKRLFTRLSNDLRAVGELGLALLMTAGVASCGGQTASSTIGDSGTGTKDVNAKDAHTGVEGSVVEGVIDGPAQIEGGVVIDGPPPGHIEGGVIDGPGGVIGVEGGVIDGHAQVEGGVIDGPPPGH